MNLVEKNLEKVISKHNRSYILNVNVFSELLKAILTKPESVDYVLYAINLKLFDKPLNYKIILFELINRLFDAVIEFRLPFIKFLQKSIGNLLGFCKNEKHDSLDFQFKTSILTSIVNWNEKYGKLIPQIQLCLNFLRSKFKNDVEKFENSLRNKKLKNQKRLHCVDEERKRNYQHLIEVYEDNKITIKTSLTTIKSCYNLLIPNVVENSERNLEALEVDNPDKIIIYPGYSGCNNEDLPIEFSGPSTQIHSKLRDDIAIDISSGDLCVEITENVDNKEILKTLKEEIGVLQKKFVPLLNNIIKKLKTYENVENDVSTVSKLSWDVLDCLKKFEKIKIIHNDFSATLLSSDSEQDDDFIDVF